MIAIASFFWHFRIIKVGFFFQRRWHGR